MTGILELFKRQTPAHDAARLLAELGAQNCGDPYWNVVFSNANHVIRGSDVVVPDAAYSDQTWCQKQRIS